MKRQVTLDYTITLGQLAPYAKALQEGRALASACNNCEFTAFPPRVVCTQCESNDFTWKKLSGGAQILERTAGTDREFALVQFSGADTRTVVRLHDIPVHASIGRLIVPRDELIGLWLGADVPDAGEGY